MLSNTDFVMMLNQATSDRVELAALLNISNQQLSYVTNSQAGQGLLFAGNSIVRVYRQVPDRHGVIFHDDNESRRNSGTTRKRCLKGARGGALNADYKRPKQHNKKWWCCPWHYHCHLHRKR